MRIASIIFAAAMSACLLFSACGKKEGVDTSKLEKSFASAEAGVKDVVDKAIAAVKEGKYGEAAGQLTAAAGNAGLTDDQKSALQDVIDQVQAKIKEAAGKAAEDAKKAAGDLTKSLGGN